MSAFFMRIGLTGNIATGKSVAFQALCKLDQVVGFDADAEVHSLYETDEVKNAIVSHFGADVIDEAGNVDRARLRGLFLKDPNVKVILEGLFHPLVYERYEEVSSNLGSREILVADIPLLFEKESAYQFSSVITVACSSDIQLRRLMSRSNLDKAVALEMIKKQVALSHKMSKSDFVLWNNGSLDQFQNQLNLLVHHIFNEYR